jgi:hypothetical protein
VSTTTPISLTAAPPRALADRIFRIAVAVNLVLTAFALLASFTGVGAGIAGRYVFDGDSAFRILFSVVFFNGIWALIWYGVKNLLLAKFVRMSREDRRAVFSSRMSQPFDLPGLLARYSERRIRIVDMIGRRGRFISLVTVIFYFLYANIAADRPDNFTSAFTAETLLDAVFLNWLTIALFYRNGFVGALFFGAQARIMDGALGRANFLTIVTLWAMFKFTLIPIGAQLQTLYPPEHFAILFALIWGTYFIVDTMAEVGGSLYGTMKIPVRGIGETNRKSIGGTVTGLVSGLAFAIGIVLASDLPSTFIAMAVVLACASSALELFSPRGTDDFTMATGNALIVWAFGAWIF